MFKFTPAFSMPTLVVVMGVVILVSWPGTCYGCCTVLLTFSLGSHLNLRNPSAGSSIAIFNAPASLSLISGSSAKCETTISASTSSVSTSSTRTLTLTALRIIQTLIGPPTVLKTVSIASSGGGHNPSSLAK